MPTFKDAKRADRLAAIQQMAVKDAPPHWWGDPELAAVLEERAEAELEAAEERMAPLVDESRWEFQELQDLENGADLPTEPPPATPRKVTSTKTATPRRSQKRH